MRKFAGFAVACLLVSGIVVAGDVTSGLPVGEKVPAFNVRDITGPEQGKTLCYRCKYGARPVVTVFTKVMNEEVASLVKQIDAKVNANEEKKMAAFVVFLTDDADKVEPKIEALAKEQKITKTPLTLIEGAGPSDYKLSKDAEVTVMMWVKSEVKVNQAFGKGELNKKAVDGLVAETKKILAD